MELSLSVSLNHDAAAGGIHVHIVEFMLVTIKVMRTLVPLATHVVMSVVYISCIYIIIYILQIGKFLLFYYIIM